MGLGCGLRQEHWAIRVVLFADRDRLGGRGCFHSDHSAALERTHLVHGADQCGDRAAAEELSPRASQSVVLSITSRLVLLVSLPTLTPFWRCETFFEKNFLQRVPFIFLRFCDRMDVEKCQRVPLF